MTFQVWKISFLIFKTFHDFPGCVGTLNNNDDDDKMVYSFR